MCEFLISILFESTTYNDVVYSLRFFFDHIHFLTSYNMAHALQFRHQFNCIHGHIALARSSRIRYHEKLTHSCANTNFYAQLQQQKTRFVLRVWSTKWKTNKHLSNTIGTVENIVFAHCECVYMLWDIQNTRLFDFHCLHTTCPTFGLWPKVPNISRQYLH